LWGSCCSILKEIYITEGEKHEHFDDVSFKELLFESVFYYILQEKFEDAKWVIRNCTPKDRQYNGQKKIEERQTIQWLKENRGKRDNTMVKRK
jgi:hypothetical protein